MKKTDGAGFFRKKSIWPFLGKKGPKRAQNEVFGIFMKIESLLFSDFGPELEKFKGPIKSLLSICQSVCLSVRHALFSELAHYFFLIFSMKLGYHT